MKHLIIAVLTLSLVFFGGGFLTNYVVNIANQMVQEVEDVKVAAEQSDWSAASFHLNHVHTLWEKHKKNWGFIINHNEIDEIDYILSKTGAHLKHNQRQLLLGELNGLLSRLEQVPDKYTLQWKNIF